MVLGQRAYILFYIRAPTPGNGRLPGAPLHAPPPAPSTPAAEVQRAQPAQAARAAPVLANGHTAIAAPPRSHSKLAQQAVLGCAGGLAQQQQQLRLKQQQQQQRPTLSHALPGLPGKRPSEGTPAAGAAHPRKQQAAQQHPRGGAAGVPAAQAPPATASADVQPMQVGAQQCAVFLHHSLCTSTLNLYLLFQGFLYGDVCSLTGGPVHDRASRRGASGRWWGPRWSRAARRQPRSSQWQA